MSHGRIGSPHGWEPAFHQFTEPETFAAPTKLRVRAGFGGQIHRTWRLDGRKATTMCGRSLLVAKRTTDGVTCRLCIKRTV